MKKWKQEIKLQGLSCQMRYGLTKRKDEKMKFEVYNCTTREQEIAIGTAIYEAMRRRGFVDGWWSWSIDIDWIPHQVKESQIEAGGIELDDV